jgi:ACS family hexuronate transporter-like MFS transporter
MFIFALLVVPVVSAQSLGAINPWFAIAIIGVATAAHQAWSANIFTTVSDMFPKKAVASVTGIGGMAGAIGGILIAKTVGHLLDYYKQQDRIEEGYFMVFIGCGLAYLVAWLVMHLFAPRMERVPI